MLQNHTRRSRPQPKTTEVVFWKSEKGDQPINAFMRRKRKAAARCCSLDAAAWRCYAVELGGSVGRISKQNRFSDRLSDSPVYDSKRLHQSTCNTKSRNRIGWRCAYVYDATKLRKLQNKKAKKAAEDFTRSQTCTAEFRSLGSVLGL